MEEFAKWVQTYQSIIAVVLGVTGWIANHYFTLRAQNKNFIKQLYNTARIDITSALREYEEYLIELEKYCIEWIEKTKLEKDNAGFPVSIFDYWNESDWIKEIERYNKLNSNYNLKWKFAMEEYFSLIHSLIPIYDKLVKRDKELVKLSYMIQSDLDYMLENCSKNVGIILSGSIDEAEIKIDDIQKQICLVKDLLVLLQNLCFSKITGNKLINKRHIKIEGAL